MSVYGDQEPAMQGIEGVLSEYKCVKAIKANEWSEVAWDTLLLCFMPLHACIDPETCMPTPF